MRDNPVKATLAAGGRAFGALVFEFFSPGLPQLCRNAGADFVLYDMEHTGLGFETLKTQFALCRGLSVVPMVRVPRGEYHFIARALDETGGNVTRAAKRLQISRKSLQVKMKELGLRGATDADE